MKMLLSGGRSRAEIEAARRRYYDTHPRLPELGWKTSAAVCALLLFFAGINGCHHLIF